MNKLRRLLLCVLMLTALMGLGAQINADWAVRGGCTGEDASYSIATDTNGNSYITGYIDSSADFGSTTLVPTGYYDTFVAKVDANGNWLWAVKAGGANTNAFARGIATDAAGNVFIIGHFLSTIYFGSIPLTSYGAEDVFIAKLDTNGNWMWAQHGGGAGQDYGFGIATDGSGNCYATGKFAGTANFGFPISSSGGTDIFVVKLNAFSSWLWARSAGGTGSESGQSIAASSEGNVFLTGYFTSPTANFGSLSLSSMGNNDVFAAKLDSNGNWQWASQAGGPNYDVSSGITVDGSGNSYITGSFTGQANFSAHILNSYPTTLSDAFVAKLDVNGYWLWASRAGGIAYDYGTSIISESNGDVFVTGLCIGTATFGTITLTNPNSAAFVAKLDTDGTWLWAQSAIASSNGIARSSGGGCIITGVFYQTAAFGETTLTSIGVEDIFVAKISAPVPQTPSNIQIYNLANDVHIVWDAVTQDTYGNTLAPDFYVIYYNYSQQPGGTYSFLAYTLPQFRHYVHQYAGLYSTEYFYNVTAVKFYGGSYDRAALEIFLDENLRPGMTESEVKAVLDRLADE